MPKIKFKKRKTEGNTEWTAASFVEVLAPHGMSARIDTLPDAYASLVYTYLSFIDLTRLSNTNKILYGSLFPWSLFLDDLATEMKQLPGYKKPGEEEAESSDEEEEKATPPVQAPPQISAAAETKEEASKKKEPLSAQLLRRMPVFPGHMTRNDFECQFVHAMRKGLQLPQGVSAFDLLRYLFTQIVSKMPQPEYDNTPLLHPVIFNVASFNPASSHAFTPKETALFFSRKEEKPLLLQRVDVVYKRKQAERKLAARIYWAILHDEVEALKRIVENAEKMPEKESYRRQQSALFIAARYNKLQAMEILCARMSPAAHKKAVNDVHGNVDFTPLHIATYLGHIAAAKHLLTHKADPNQQTKLVDFSTPLLQALGHQNVAMLTLLLKHKADPNLGKRAAVASFYITPLQYVVGMMKKKNADTHARPERIRLIKEYALPNCIRKIDYARPSHLVTLLQTLLTYKADPLKTGYEAENLRSKKKKGKTPLALLENLYPKVAALLEAAEKAQKAGHVRKESARYAAAESMPPLEPAPFCRGRLTAPSLFQNSSGFFGNHAPPPCPPLPPSAAYFAFPAPPEEDAFAQLPSTLWSMRNPFIQERGGQNMMKIEGDMSEDFLGNSFT